MTLSSLSRCLWTRPARAGCSLAARRAYYLALSVCQPRNSPTHQDNESPEQRRETAQTGQEHVRVRKRGKDSLRAGRRGGGRGRKTAPRNGIWLAPGEPPAVVVAGTRTDRRLASVRLNYGLRGLGEGVFSECRGLRRVLLGEGLETISEECFWSSGAEEMAVPGSVRCVERLAFGESSLRRVRFLGTGGSGDSAPRHARGNAILSLH